MLFQVESGVYASLGNISIGAQLITEAVEKMRAAGQTNLSINPAVSDILLSSLLCILRVSESLALDATNSSCSEALLLIGNKNGQTHQISSFNANVLVATLSMITKNFSSQMGGKMVLVISGPHAEIFSNSESPFGDTVGNSFPSITPELLDAGKCRALGQWTACVIHLMRALEAPLNALAQSVGVTPDQNWNTALNQIDSRLKERTKSTHGIDGEQWASEASAHLRAIKNAWRNHAAHGRTRYNEAEATAIWGNVHSIALTLSRRLTE